jgi:O-antigen/teichoic acid export membrane protein
MKLSTKIAYNSIVQVGGKIISTIVGLFTIALITRHLGQFGFGEYTTIFTYLSFFAIIADLGITLVTVQMISRPSKDENYILSNLFTLRLVSIVFFLAISPILIIFFPYSQAIKIGVLIATLNFLFPALNQVLVGVFQKHLRMDKVTIAEILGKIVLFIGVLAVVSFKFSLYGIILVSAISSFANFLSLYIFSRKFARIGIAYDKPIWKEIAGKSWPLAITITFNLIYLKTDTLILSLIKSQNEVGIYGAAYKIIEVLGTIPFMFAGIVLPILTSSWLKGDKEKYYAVLQKSMDAMIILSIPLIVGTQFISGKIMGFVAGQEFLSSGAPLKILIIALGSIFIGCIPAHALIAIDKQRKLIGAYIFTAISSLAGYLIFIPMYSYIGAAWVTVYSETIITLILIYLLKKYSAFIPNLSILWRSVAASFVMGISIFQLKNLNVLVLVLIGAAVYFIVLYGIGGIKKELIKDLIKRA